MKSYDQLCAVARALDVVGDRWTLLIVRELLIRDRARYTDIQNGLPGVAPNLLAQRLRDLEQQGVVWRENAVAPLPGVLYQLTARGRELEGVIRELLKWGAPTVPAAPNDATFQMHWLSLPAQYLLHDHRPSDDDILIRFGTIADGFDAAVTAGSTMVGPCQPDARPDVTVNGAGRSLVGLLQGAIPITDASVAGIDIQGNPHTLQRVLPPAP